MKILFIFLSSTIFLFAIDGVKNISLNTMDPDEVITSVSNRLSSSDLKNLGVNADYKKHINNIETLKNEIKTLILHQGELRKTQKEHKQAVQNYNESQNKYNKKMQEIYAKSSGIKRESYYVVKHALDQAYMPSVKNHLIDKYAIEKYDQKTEIEESSQGIVSYKNVVSTNKYFGQMQVETIQDITYRDQNTNFKIIKVIQSPFVQTSKSDFSKSFQKEIDKFSDELNLDVYQISNKEELDSKYTQVEILEAIKQNIPFEKSNKRFKASSKKIRTTLAKITKEHDRYIKNVNALASKIASMSSKLEEQTKVLNRAVAKSKKLADYYSIKLNYDELEKLVILTPKVFVETVSLGEEKEFVLRKAKSYLSKISVSQVQQSETLNASYDLNTKNLNKTKLIEYESIHLFAFVKAKKLATLIFGVIELEDKVSSSDYISKDLAYASMNFVPINKGFETLFASTTEITLGVVKEFLQTHKQRKYFDEFCIEDSTLPEQARDFKNITKEYYDYPAVCFKVNKIDDFLDWLSLKVDKKLKLPSSQQWSYVASNANSSDFCWGNDNLEELNLDESQPENIYYENDEDTYLQPIKQYEKSLLGMYDMCGNVHEFVEDEGVLMIKGNSYISFIENSNAPAQEYSPDLNTMIGMRVFYTKEK